MTSVEETFFGLGTECSSAKCLVAWEKVCNTKESGGLGIKDLGIQNVCLLLKLVHKLHYSENSAWARWVRQRFNFATMESELQGGHRELLKAILPLYQALTSVQLGDETTTSFWLDVCNGDGALADR